MFFSFSSHSRRADDDIFVLATSAGCQPEPRRRQTGQIVHMAHLAQVEGRRCQPSAEKVDKVLMYCKAENDAEQREQGETEECQEARLDAELEPVSVSMRFRCALFLPYCRGPPSRRRKDKRLMAPAAAAYSRQQTTQCSRSWADKWVAFVVAPMGGGRGGALVPVCQSWSHFVSRAARAWRAWRAWLGFAGPHSGRVCFQPCQPAVSIGGGLIRITGVMLMTSVSRLKERNKSVRIQEDRCKEDAGEYVR